jgi:hypothetical protein
LEDSPLLALNLGPAIPDVFFKLNSAFVYFFLCLQQRFPLFALGLLNALADEPLRLLLRAANLRFGNLSSIINPFTECYKRRNNSKCDSDSQTCQKIYYIA